ncbi:uncharacterized protein LOC129805540 [Phlebotomus papatasi]|uniref:uncharacterized protein LOC129805540 n=1 Tax=Phlebotomus papatasi TaxID=29031 RepID=UPI002483B94E|nr:uncharacterized protein LOC129805540 [Phlebotomus papatasi]
MSRDVGTSRELSASEITQLFIETAQKIDKCFDFEVAKWLERYQELRKQPNFPEAALLIINAAQIYGRKVDYLEEIILNIARESEARKNAEKNKKRGVEGEEVGKRKRLKRFRPETLCEKFHCVEYVVKEFKSLPAASLCEKVVRKARCQGGMTYEEEFGMWTLRKDAKGKKGPRRRLEMEEEELCSNYTSFGESHIFDYDGEDIVGRRRDFKVFSGHIDAENQAIGNDINLRKYYKRGEIIETACPEASNLEDCSLMNPVTVQVPEIREKESMENFGNNLLVQELPDLPPPSPNILLSDDEGIGMSHNTIQLSDLNEKDWNMLSPNVELVDIMEHVKDVPTTEFTVDSSLTNLLGIDRAYLTHPEDFYLPLNLFEQKSIVELNFLKISEKKLRSKCLFSLPKEWLAEWRLAKRPPPPIPPIPRVFRLDQSLQNIPTPPATPEPDDPEEFRGFDESEIADLSLSNSRIFSSTINPEKSFPISPPKQPRMSADSGIQSPPHTMDILDSILEENTSQIISSESGYGSLLRSLDESDVPETPEKSKQDSLILPNATLESSPELQLSDHQMNLQRIAAEEHRQRVEDMKRMTDKVNRWHEYLKPILRLSQSRGHFDIHAYGTEILDVVNPQKNPTLPTDRQVSLGEIMEMKKDPRLLPRYFLSMLQLINSNNISIQAKKDINSVTKLHDIHIKFKSAERHHEELSEGLNFQKGEQKRKRSPSDGEMSKNGQKKHRKGAVS